MPWWVTQQRQQTALGHLQLMLGQDAVTITTRSPCFILTKQVKRVYLLVRGRKTFTASERVEKMLCGPLFHMLHKQVATSMPSAFRKVVAVEGDLCLPGLGLSESDKQQLLDNVEHVIHCAANIELDADIQKSLK
jgi:fatty acyl-CoA reductase